MATSKEETARQLAQAHAELDSSIVTVLRVLGSQSAETDDREPVKLLEVNQNTPATGIQPLYFRADPEAGVHYPCVIIEITPEEYAALQRGDLALPNGWRIDERIEVEDSRLAT